jgi:hypothetical protein
MTRYPSGRWIQRSKSHIKKGALRKQLHIKEGKTIPIDTLKKIVQTPIGGRVRGVTVTRLVKQRANWAVNVRGR